MTPDCYAKKGVDFLSNVPPYLVYLLTMVSLTIDIEHIVGGGEREKPFGYCKSNKCAL